MKTINFNFNEFDLRNFINNYNKKIRLVFGMNGEEPLGRIVEVLEHNTLCMKYIEEDYRAEEIIDLVENEKIALFLPLGMLGDVNGIFLRLINMKQYRVCEGIAEGTYNDAKRFKLDNNILDLGDLSVNSDSSIGVVITKIDKKIFLSFAQYDCGSCVQGPSLTVKENTGNLATEIQDYLYEYKK